jgi:hypothetical protein
MLRQSNDINVVERKFSMRKILFVAAAILVAGAGPSEAREYAWCARTALNDFNPQCDFSTLGQCQMTVSGQGGDCIRNPALAYGQVRNGRAPGYGWQSGGWQNNGWDNRRW